MGIHATVGAVARADVRIPYSRAQITHPTQHFHAEIFFCYYYNNASCFTSVHDSQRFRSRLSSLLISSRDPSNLWTTCVMFSPRLAVFH